MLGPKGTFSDNAATEYINKNNKHLQKIYYNTIDDTFHSIGKDCDLGIIPVENTLDGFVQRTLDLLLEMDIHINCEISVPVQFALIGNVEDVKDIKRLYVQFKANGQCRTFIDSLSNVIVVGTNSNMESFNIVESGSAGDAAIIPCHMVEHSKAKLKIHNVTDSANNFTRFIVVEKGNYIQNIENGKLLKVSLYIMPQEDRPGILYDILKEFSVNKINMVAIMSRPTKVDMGKYNFYIELSGEYKQRETILSVLSEINKNYGLKILGFYNICD